MFAMGIQRTASYSTGDITQGRGFAVNNEAADGSGNLFRFVLASGALAQYDCVAISSTGVAQAITSTLAGAGAYVGVVQAALSSGYYGWAQVLGVTSLNVLSTCSAGVALYTSGTAGSLDDTSSSQVKISGAQVLSNATTAGTYGAILTTRPFAAL